MSIVWTDSIVKDITHIKKIHIDEIRSAIDGHFGLGGVTVHANATSVLSGFMSATDKQRLDSLVASSGGNITAVTATSPIISSLGITPNISILPSSPSQNGYLSKEDKVKIDSISVPDIGIVKTVLVTAPINKSGIDPAYPTIGIDPATTVAAGSMSAVDKYKLDILKNVPVGFIGNWWGDPNNHCNGNGLGLVGDVLEGWAICNGNNGTPNMIDRFAYGAGNVTSGQTGGEAFHTLTPEEMPNHAHEVYGSGGHGWNSGGGWAPLNHDRNALVASTDLQGGSQPHNNIPPYMAVWFIMRVS